MIWLPRIEHVILLHEKMAACSGGSVGIRDRGLIESALARGDSSFGQVELYPSVIEKAAAIGCGLTQNHGFIDGNKRIGMATMLLILRRNQITLSFTQEELIALGLAVAQGSFTVEDTVAWITAHTI